MIAIAPRILETVFNFFFMALILVLMQAQNNRIAVTERLIFYANKMTFYARCDKIIALSQRALFLNGAGLGPIFKCAMKGAWFGVTKHFGDGEHCCICVFQQVKC